MENNEIIFTKVRDVKSPTRANQNDAGIDFYCPVIDEKLGNDFQKKNEPNESNAIILPDIILVAPGADIVIPSGIKVWIKNKDSALIAANKSGMATSKHTQFTCQVVDADYTGEIHIGIRNHGSRFLKIESGQKLIQFIHTPIIKSNLIEISPDEYKEITDGQSDRGEGGFGSTGNK